MNNPLPIRSESCDDAWPLEDLFPRTYHSLRNLAAQFLRRERADHTLQATALVHEAYIRLSTAQAWKNQAHFYGSAAETMLSACLAPQATILGNSQMLGSSHAPG